MNYVFEMFAGLSATMAVLTLALHFIAVRIGRIPSRDLAFYVQMSAMAAVMALIMFWGMNERSLFIAAVTIFTFAAGIYTIICNWLVFSEGATWLTKHRGEKWVKEIDYLYILFGAFGLFGVINRLDVVTDKVTRMDLVAPLLVSLALVLRLIKTRAEIGGWNRSR